MLTGSDDGETEYNVRLQQIDECPLCEMDSTYIYKIRQDERTPTLAVGEKYPYHVDARVCCGNGVAYYHLDVGGTETDVRDVSDGSGDESLYDTHG